MYKKIFILLVEDDDIDAHIARCIIKSVDDQVIIHHCHNGKEALDFLIDKNNPRPDLVLLDISMPVMDGKEFLLEKSSRSEMNNIPVVILSSSALISEKNECFELGAVNYMEKPIEVKSFEGILKLYSFINLN